MLPIKNHLPFQNFLDYSAYLSHVIEMIYKDNYKTISINTNIR